MNNKKTTAIWTMFAVLNNPLSPILADKQATEDELNIGGGNHILACY